MTKHDLKELAAMGAELGAAKAENERLRNLLTTLRISLNLDDTEYGLSKQEKSSLAADIDAELSRQAEPVCQTMQRPKAECGCPDCGSSLIDWPKAEPTDTYTAVDMATAAAQGFRDGQAAVEPAAAQDERKTFEVEIPDISAIYDGRSFIPYRSLEAGERLMTVAQHLRIEKQLRAELTRPAQTEQQPDQSGLYTCIGKGGSYELIGRATTAGALKVTGRFADEVIVYRNTESSALYCREPGDFRLRMARSALSAQGAAKFRMGDLVKKSTGSEWEGRVVGWYSTEQTPEGYAVESSAHRNSVQIYPATALEAVE